MGQRNDERLVILLPRALKKDYQQQQTIRNRDDSEYVSLADIVREALEDYRNSTKWQRERKQS